MSIGIQETGGTDVTAALLPAGTDVYFALFEDEEATVEVSSGWYSRVAYTGWSQSGDGLTRSNTSPITFPTTDENIHIGAIGWFKASSGGAPVYTVLFTFYSAGFELANGDFIEIPVGLFKLVAS